MKKVFLLTVILFLLLSPVSHAEDKQKSTGDSVYSGQIDSLDTKGLEKFIDQLNGETSGYIPPIDFKKIVEVFKTGNISYSMKEMLLGLFRYFLNDVLLNTKLLGQIIILTIICAVLQNLENAMNSDAVSNLAYYACYLVLTILIVKSFSIAVAIGRDTINRMVDFMTAMIPTLMTLLASVGGLASVSTLDPIIMFCIGFISNTVRDFILPGIFLTAILSIINNLSDTFQVKKLAGLIKQVCVWAMGLMLTFFIGIITIRGTAAKTLDQVTAKTLKFAVDNFIPVIGKCLSDAISTIAGYSLILKDAVSTAGLIAFVVMCIFPLIKIISMIFIYRISAALIEPISDKRIVNCLSEIGNSLTLIFASVLCVAVMFFIMVTIIAATGKSAVMAG
jgi:stage III sporulation protein AE